MHLQEHSRHSKTRVEWTLSYEGEILLAAQFLNNLCVIDLKRVYFSASSKRHLPHFLLACLFLYSYIQAMIHQIFHPTIFFITEPMIVTVIHS